MHQLREQTILVTGAGRGLGHGVCRGLAAYGATVLAAARTESELAELATTIRASGGTIATYLVDLADPLAITNLAGRIATFHGGIDTLINNAAILRMIPFQALAADAFEETIAVNLLAPVRLTRAFLPAMIARGRGAVINVSSAAGIRPFENETDYCAAKYGLEGFSLSLAMELAAANISVNLVSPGYRIKPTSITAAEFAAWPCERQMEYRDPIDMADGFAFLARQFPGDGGLTGQRFNAFELAERVRQQGWDWHRSTPDRASIATSESQREEVTT